MSEFAIRAQGVSKQYQIGVRRTQHDTLRDTLTDLMKAPLRRFRQLSGNVHRGQEYFHALQDVSFDVRHGEVVGIIGKNGAGKSTLLKVLSRITEPTAGRVELYGRVGSLLEVGTGFHPELTGRENIYMNGSILGMKKKEIDQKFDEIVEFSGVEKFLDTPVKRYSSGMYVRLAFAVAAHLEPEILLVDEVLAVGDAQFQKKCLGKMKDVAGQGRTVLFISHNMQAIRSLCDRCILLSGGQIAAEGNTMEIVQKYLYSGESIQSQVVWSPDERPGNEWIRIHAIRTKNAEGEECSTVYLSEDTIVEIEYEILLEGASAQFSILLHDADGNCIFVSLSNLEKDYHGTLFPVGRYQTRCRIHGNLLNPGRYFITVNATAHGWMNAFRIDQAVTFEALDDGILRGDYYGNYGSVIRPKLEWQTRMAAGMDTSKVL
ncbi:MAG: ABC transporter ATP-binding protein [bacterium]|jgi:lipopolysaccharide transport system ATP-binding protein